MSELMGLPLTKRGSNVQDLLPDKEAFERCFEIITTLESAEYLEYAVKARYEDKKDDFNTTKVIVEFRKNMEAAQRKASKIWIGELPNTSEFKNLNENLSNKAAQDLILKDKDQLIMAIAINNDANFQRGFAVNSNPPTADELKGLEQLLNGWFAQNNMRSVSSTVVDAGGNSIPISTLYETDSEGKFLTDAQNNPILILSEKFKDLLMDEKLGFSNYCQQKGLNTTTAQQDYPTAVTTQPQVKQRAEEQVEQVAQEAEEPTVKPGNDISPPTI